MVEEPETVSRSDFANDEAWQAHVAKWVGRRCSFG